MQPSSKIIKLSELKLGQKGQLISQPDNPAFMQIMNMGGIPGEKIELRNIGPFGDPIVYITNDILISVRRVEAETVKIKMIEP